MKAHIHMINYIIKNGKAAAVKSEGQLLQSRTTNAKKLVEAIDGVDEIVALVVLSPQKDCSRRYGSVYILDDGDENTVLDYTENQFLEDGFKGWGQ